MATSKHVTEASTQTEQLADSLQFVKDAKESTILVNWYNYPKDLKPGWYTVLIEDRKADDVLGLLHNTVNSARFRKMNQTFYFVMALSNDSSKYVIRLKSRGTRHQPGNGIVSMRSKNKPKFSDAHLYDEIIGILEAKKIDGPKLAESLRILNRSCGDKEVEDEIIHELYFLLLFEITRRMVDCKDKTHDAEVYDSLPIAIAVARLILLMDRNHLTIEQVFRSSSDYHVFSGKGKKRAKHLENINNLYSKFFEEGTPTDELEFAFSSESNKEPKEKEKYIKTKSTKKTTKYEAFDKKTYGRPS